MCGIVGYITTESKLGEMDRSRFLRQALIVDTLRGDDSTGVFSVPFEPAKDDGTAFWIKQVGPGSALVDCKEYWENFADVPADAVVNKASTFLCQHGTDKKQDTTLTALTAFPIP